MICEGIVKSRGVNNIYGDSVDRRCKNKAKINGLCLAHHKVKFTCLCGNRIENEKWGVCYECR